MVNAHYEFIYVESRINGRVLDSGVLKVMDCYRLLENNDLKIPSPEYLSAVGHGLPLSLFMMEFFLWPGTLMIAMQNTPLINDHDDYIDLIISDYCVHGD